VCKSPPWILLPSIILFPSKIFPFQKAQSKNFFLIFKGKNPHKGKAKQKVQKLKIKPQKAKALLPPSRVFYSNKQGRAMGRGMTL
jgi:hypothetical protein